MSRTAPLNDDTMPVPTNNATSCTSATLIWNAATPIVPGIIWRTTRRTVSFFHGETQR